MSEGMSEQTLLNVKQLRRYARALYGSQSSGDFYVRSFLETCLLDHVSHSTFVSKVKLFKKFHDVWQGINFRDERPVVDLSHVRAPVESRLEGIPLEGRQILLLTALESFSVREASDILGLSEVDGNAMLVKAWVSLGEQVPASVLLIEDDPITAEDVAGLVTQMGHTVIAVTADQAEAVALAKTAKPDLVMSDIDLGAGGSGLLAVQEILQAIDVPVIFVTGCPEMLLTGDRPEPTYLVSKPFDVDALRVTVSQALSLNTIKGSSEKARQSTSPREEALTKTG